jgi:hypothetical protein
MTVTTSPFFSKLEVTWSTKKSPAWARCSTAATTQRRERTSRTEGIARIRDLTVEFKRYVDASRLLGLLRHPTAALVGLVD